MEIKKCCANCNSFDSRNRFCRVNPPQPIIFVLEGKKVTESQYPVVKLPEVDWCQKFQADTKQKLILEKI
jgi:hypothetical protein